MEKGWWKFGPGFVFEQEHRKGRIYFLWFEFSESLPLATPVRLPLKNFIKFRESTRKRWINQNFGVGVLVSGKGALWAWGQTGPGVV